MDPSFRRTTHHTNFRPKDDGMRIHGSVRSGRPTLYSITLGSSLGIRRIRSKIGALVVMNEVIIDGHFFATPNSTRAFDRSMTPCRYSAMSALYVIFTYYLV